MLNFKDRREILPSTLILLSIIILASTFIVMVFVPPPSVAGIAKSHENQREQLLREIALAKTTTDQTQRAIQPRLWQGGADTISAAVLEQLTAQTRQHSVSLGAFRPQRPQELNGVTELPFTVELSGSYPGIQAVIEALDTPGSKLVVRSVQLGSSQTAGKGVSATLGLSAYAAAATAPTIVHTTVKAGSHA